MALSQNMTLAEYMHTKAVKRDLNMKLQIEISSVKKGSKSRHFASPCCE